MQHSSTEHAGALADLKEKLGIGADKVHAVIGAFTEGEDLVAAGKQIYAKGYRQLDAMSPFPVHGIDDSIGIPRSPIGRIAIVFSILGLLTAQALMYYVGVINYPLVIGGKPLFDFTYSIPVTFELTILFTGIATTILIFGLSGLPRLYHPTMNYKLAHRASDDRFLLIIEASDPMFNAGQAVADLKAAGATEVEVVEG